MHMSEDTPGLKECGYHAEDMRSKMAAKMDGFYAGLSGEAILSNPYFYGTTLFRLWVDGWVDGVKCWREKDCLD